MRALVLIVTMLVSCFAIPGSAQAFHEIESFSRSGQGGGEGNFFTGSPRFKGYDCAICHTNTEGRISIALEVNRPELLQGQYKANTGYSIIVKLVGEHRGLESAFNPNTFMLEIITDQGESVGDFLPGPAPTELIDEGRIIAAEGFGEGETEWSFTWFSPRDPVGPLTLHIAMLDGDGAGEPELRFIDPLNDDVATMTLRLCPEGEACPAQAGDAEIESKVHCNLAGTNSSATSALLWLVIALVFLGSRARGFGLATLLMFVFACSSAARPAARPPAVEGTPTLLEFRVIRDGSDFMKNLCESVVADSRAGVMRIETGLDVWQNAEGATIKECYLSAVDRTAMLNSQEAEAEDCRSRGDVERTACVVSGRHILERYLAGRNDVEPEPGHALAFELAESSAIAGEIGERYWRSYYLDRESQIKGDMVHEVAVQTNESTAESQLLIEFDAEGAKRLEELTRSNLGHKLAIVWGGRVISAPVIRSVISGGKVPASLGPDSAAAEDLAASIRERR
jgi:hypothetical protein